MSGHITVGYNATPSSAAAVFWAAEEAAARGAPLRIVSCQSGAPANDAYVTGPDLELMAEMDMTPIEGICESIRKTHPRLRVTTETSTRSPHDALIDQASPPDLLVVGSTRHEGPEVFGLGSTARRLSRDSPCPVVVVRRYAPIGRPIRIVVGVDGSAPSDDAVLWAADEADLHRSELVVVHGWWYPYRRVDAASEQARDLTRVDAACVLERAVAAGRERCGAAVTGQLIERSPVSALLDASRPGDLLVVGSRGHGAITSALFGSTVSRLLDLSPFPVAVVRDRSPS